MKSSIEIILKDDVHRIFDAFSACFKIRIGFLSPEGKQLLVGLEKPGNEFCMLVRNALDKKKKCLALDEEKRKEALLNKDLFTWQCYAGMIESIIPIYFDGIHLGFFMMGQYRSEKKINRSLLLEYAKRFGASEELIISYLKTPSFSEEEIKDMQKFFKLIVNYIVSQNLIIIKSNLVLEKIINHARIHYDQQLSISEAARIAGRSTSTVSHLFTGILHKTFKQVMIELKMEKAEEFFKKEPDITVKEAAMRLGYDDPYYFSRVFKKRRGVAPSKFVSKDVL